MALLFLDVEPIALYVLTPTRLDPLLAGSALAALVRGGIDGIVLQRAALAGICGGAVVSAVVALLSGGFGELSPLVQIVGYSGVTGVGAGLLAMLVSPQPALALQRVFSLAPIRVLGRYSYGIYLFHFPIIMVVLVSQRTWLMDLLESAGRWPMVLAVLVLSTACTSMLAVASYHLLEKRCLGLKRFFPHPTS
jgi:peptidoglycan/LPS O-acetylase OafA/YrhL